MENAGNIFYDENTVNGQQEMEALIAHEIAHQWFGNSASESDWKHLWLSEGFATYFTDLYFENQYGTAAMNERLKGERKKVIQFSKRYPHPVIDTTYASLMHLLNPHSYQKGAWVLHMLRTTIGDSAFFSGIRTYYTTYKFGNASSNDFQKCMQTKCRERPYHLL
jgi:aminopeptidase N